MGIDDLKDRKVLDLGCGSRGVLRDFIRYGDWPENCYGIDLLPGRIAEAVQLSPNIDFQCGNAENLPYEDEFVDILLCLTVFSSIFDKNMKANIAKEILRVVKSTGMILWFDFHMNNPQNPDVRGVKRDEIYDLFQGYKIFLKRIILAPPISRFLAPYSVMLCQILEKLRFLNTHYIGIITKI